MLSILESISPVFIVIALGYFSRRLGFLPDVFIQSANRLVYYIAIPVLVFNEISKGSFTESFHPHQIAGTLVAVTVVMVLGIVTASALGVTPGGRATLAQTSYHGNLGYIGLAVVFYALGTSGRGSASVLVGFLILFQNMLSIGLFTFVAGGENRITGRLIWKFLGNPIILATLLGLSASATGINLPEFMERSFTIVSNMALPLALLIIGGSLKPTPVRKIQLVALSALLKLLVLPMAGFAWFRVFGVAPVHAAAAVILLASPSATISYVMAAEMGGEKDMAAAAVTVSTLLSIITYTLWISLTGAILR